MKELIKCTESNTRDELWRASKEHGVLNASSHESYAIIKEEYEETIDEMAKLKIYLEMYWAHVKHDDSCSQIEALKRIYTHSILAAAEAQQTAAMALKAIRTVTDDEFDLNSILLYPKVTDA